MIGLMAEQTWGMQCRTEGERLWRLEESWRLHLPLLAETTGQHHPQVSGLGATLGAWSSKPCL